MIRNKITERKIIGTEIILRIYLITEWLLKKDFQKTYFLYYRHNLCGEYSNYSPHK